MGENIHIMVQEWMNTISKAVQYDFLGLKSLFNLRFIEVQPELIRAAAMFWDKKDRVFRFGPDRAELCPTVDEFDAFLGTTTTSKIVMASCTAPHVHEVGLYLPLSKEWTKCLLVDDEYIKLDGLVPLYYVPNDEEYIEDKRWRERRKRILSFVMISEFLLKTRPGMGHIVVGKYTSQFYQGRSIGPLIVGETLNALDALVDNPEGPIGGSPLLLQMWLCEHLKIIDRPTILNYTSAGYRTRRRLQDFKSTEEWVTYMRHIPSSNIVWLCEWLKLTRMAKNTFKQKVVLLPGIKKSTFYNPARFLRQFGQSQPVPCLLSPPPQGVMDGDRVRKVGKSWEQPTWKAVRTRTLEDPVPRYKQWLEETIGPFGKQFREDRRLKIRNEPESSKSKCVRDNEKDGDEGTTDKNWKHKRPRKHCN